MLRFLRIKRLAVIDEIEVEFGAGLNVLTGETGAAQVDSGQAVGLLLGGRPPAIWFGLARTWQQWKRSSTCPGTTC